MFDVTASFTHWGMYNIPASTTSLPENAGVAGSTYGPQVINDFFAAAKYDGPCPPPGLVHHYVVTVFAIDCTVDLPNPPGFPPVGETLLYALLEGRAHIIATTSITGLYST
jgi:Raf kinase inhibitor-like YbhB/YbcL family protein